MTCTVADLDAMADAEVAFRLASCCGSSGWVAGMLARRPFDSRDNLLACADDVAHSLAPTDWLEAFSHHPKIGEAKAAADVSASAAKWSAGEQAGVGDAEADVRAELARANQEYAARFGFIFIICASGRSATEILAALRERMNNEAAAELAIAAREQQMITRLRLNKLIVDG